MFSWLFQSHTRHGHNRPKHKLPDTTKIIISCLIFDYMSTNLSASILLYLLKKPDQYLLSNPEMPVQAVPKGQIQIWLSK
jgi:hypothetical protein